MVFTVTSSICKVKIARFYKFLLTLGWRYFVQVSIPVAGFISKIQQFELAVSLKKISPLDFQQYNHFKYLKICLCARMLVLEWKERAFIEKVNSRCFCWFPVAILVHQNCTPIWRLHTRLYKGAWNNISVNAQSYTHRNPTELTKN